MLTADFLLTEKGKRADDWRYPAEHMGNERLNSLAEFWSKLTGPVHHEDKRFFDAHPEVSALFQQRFVPSAFFGVSSMQRS